MIKAQPTLILFDIDGTLTNRVGDLKDSLWRFPYAAKKLFGVTLNLTVDDYMSYNGWVDKAQFWDQLKGSGVTRKQYVKKFSKFGDYAREYLDLHSPKYRVNPGAKTLLAKLKKVGIPLGVITGNAEKVARWKLEQVGLAKFFPFGLFGDEAESRDKLAELVFKKAERYFHVRIKPEQIVMVGDTVYDIACARYIGAKIIFLVTGGKNSDLSKSDKPDLIVNSLGDPAILDFLGI